MEPLPWDLGLRSLAKTQDRRLDTAKQQSLAARLLGTCHAYAYVLLSRTCTRARGAKWKLESRTAFFSALNHLYLLGYYLSSFPCRSLPLEVQPRRLGHLVEHYSFAIDEEGGPKEFVCCPHMKRFLPPLLAAAFIHPYLPFQQNDKNP